LLALGLIAAAQAAPPARVFVSATGSDSSTNCSFAAPCRTFQKAHDTVASGGEVNVLDPAGYGSIAIDKPISIVGHGFAGISVTSGGTGISINAGTFDGIHIDGVYLSGASNTTGIAVTKGLLMLVNSTVRGFNIGMTVTNTKVDIINGNFV